MHAQADQPRERLFYFRRRFNPANRMLRGLLITAPWVDVTLLVVIFLVSQSSFVVQPGVVLDLPTAASSGYAGYGELVVTIPQEGMYFFQDERMTPDGLAAALGRAARAQPGRSLIVEADQRVSQRTLVEVYNMAAAAGLQQVLLATRSPAQP